MSLWETASAGHWLRGKYRVYGEGSIHHSGHPCEHGLGLDRHPLIFRHDWPSRRAYWRTEIANEWHGRQIGRWVRSGAFEKYGGPNKRVAVAALPSDWLNDLMLRLFGPPYRRVPTVQAGLLPKDSVYDRSEM